MGPAPICCCVPLKLGCCLVGLYNLVDFVVKLVSAVEFLLPRLQRGPVELTVGEWLWLSLTTLQCNTQLSLGICVVLGTLRERRRLLWLCAACLLLLSFFSLVLGTASAFFSKDSRIFLTYLLDFIVLSFCSFVVSAFVGQLKDCSSPMDHEET